jgi:hypothetical protein
MFFSGNRFPGPDVSICVSEILSCSGSGNLKVLSFTFNRSKHHKEVAVHSFAVASFLFEGTPCPPCIRIFWFFGLSGLPIRKNCP